MITCSLSIRFQTVKQRYLEGKSLSMSAKLSVQTFRNLPKKSKNLTLRLFTLSGSWELGLIDSLIVPGSKGQLSLFKNHINYICRTDPGILKVKGPHKNYYYVLTDSGVLRLENNVISLMVNKIEDPWAYNKIKVFRDLLEAQENFNIFVSVGFMNNSLASSSTEEDAMICSLRARMAYFAAKARKRLFLQKVRMKAAVICYKRR